MSKISLTQDKLMMKWFKWYTCFVLFQTPNDDKLATNALWGKLAAEILMQNWDAALEDLNKLKDVIDSPVSKTADQWNDII